MEGIKFSYRGGGRGHPLPLHFSESTLIRKQAVLLMEFKRLPIKNPNWQEANHLAILQAWPRS